MGIAQSDYRASAARRGRAGGYAVDFFGAVHSVLRRDRTGRSNLPGPHTALAGRHLIHREKHYPLRRPRRLVPDRAGLGNTGHRGLERSEEHTSELQSLMRISYAVFCLKKKKKKTDQMLLTIRNKNNNDSNH